MLRRKREMMQKKKLFTLVHCAKYCRELTLSAHICTNKLMHTTVTYARFLANKTLTMKHGQFSFSDSSVVHNKAQSQGSWTENWQDYDWEFGLRPAVRCFFSISRLMPQHMSLSLSQAPLQYTVTPGAWMSLSVFALVYPFSQSGLYTLNQRILLNIVFNYQYC